MGEKFITAQERRAFTRLTINAPVEVRQGESIWNLELIDLSLTGLAVTEPDELDADYSNPFFFNLVLEPNSSLEFHARIVHKLPVAGVQPKRGHDRLPKVSECGNGATPPDNASPDDARSVKAFDQVGKHVIH